MSKSAEMFDEDAKAGLAQHGAMVELGLGQNVELSLTGRIVALEFDKFHPDEIIYRVEIKDSRGIYLSSVSVKGESIVR